VWDYSQLSTADQAAFHRAVRQFVADLAAGNGRFHSSLRVHRIDARRGVWSMSFGDDLRATFSYGQPRKPGDTHIRWRRIGHHDVYREP